MSSTERYEINHDCEIVVSESALSKHLDDLIKDLFSQNKWKYELLETNSCYRKIKVTSPNKEKEYLINLFTGRIRNEDRNPYEKKIQLGPTVDPRNYKDNITIILGFYVFDEDDSIKDSIIVGYPVKEEINYPSNPSLRHTFINKILIEAKTSGICIDKEYQMVAFRPEFIFYYLQNYESLQGYKVVANNKTAMYIDIPYPHNRIIFGAPGTGKSHKLQDDVEKYFSYSINYEALLKEEIKNRPQKADKEPWFNHIGIKYADYVYKLSHEKTEPELQELWGITQNELWKMKTAARACIDYNHYVLNNCAESSTTYERVTFHPNYSYAQFVGTYKPITKLVEDKEEISYEYVPGPFIRTFINAKKTGQNVLLLIEEINRANVAAVFGDIFQLLDRKSDGTSEYPITTSEDLRNFLAKPENLGGTPEEYKTISIPSNLYIWATMNSADQGVLPMDAAFKRRWDFEYINIDEGADDLGEVTIPVPNGTKKEGDKEVTNYTYIKWNKLRKAINDQLKKVSGVNEDKLLGPFFIGDKDKIENAAKNQEQFCKSFKSKVLMYLFEDVVKMQPGELFDSKEDSNIHYSDICKDFDSKGLRIFVKAIYEQFSEFANGASE